jgi:hypothetical protein
MTVTPGVGQPYMAVYAVKPPMLVLAVVSLCFGVGGFMLLWVPFVGWILGIGAVVMGHIAVNQIQRSIQPRSGKGIAIGGLVAGYVVTVIGTFFFVVTILIGVASNH